MLKKANTKPEVTDTNSTVNEEKTGKNKFEGKTLINKSLLEVYLKRHELKSLSAKR